MKNAVLFRSTFNISNPWKNEKCFKQDIILTDVFYKILVWFPMLASAEPNSSRPRSTDNLNAESSDILEIGNVTEMHEVYIRPWERWIAVNATASSFSQWTALERERILCNVLRTYS